MRRIAVVTGTRAEYGQLFWIMKKIQNDPELELQLLVTGMHLSPEFGLTYQAIEKDFPINKKIEIILSSDTAIGISKSMGLGIISFSEAYEELKPDLILLLGDRFELFAASSSAMVARIPIAHLHGGETTEGVIDESIRHSITKMSHLHFTANEIYKNRVIQLGENPKRVFNVGGLGVDVIKKTKLLSKKDLERNLNFKFKKKNLLVTFHPVTLENKTGFNQFSELLLALDSLEDTLVIFTKPNADTDGRILVNMIDDSVASNREKFISFTSMGQVNYLSAVRYVDGVVGNSSSALAEVPTFKKGTINIGDRQKGRIKAISVIDCDTDRKSILTALELLYSTDFQEKLQLTVNPYGNGGASEKIVDVIKHFPLDDILKKEFYDVQN